MLNKSEIKPYLLSENTSIRETIKKMDQLESDFLIIINFKKNISGIFTSGDFRNAVFKGIDIKEPVSLILNKNYIYVDEEFDKSKIINLFKKNLFINFIPVLNNKKIVSLLERNDFLKIKSSSKINNLLNVSAVIMAGGKGTRMKPFSEILPKPLIPYNGIPMIDHIINNFNNNGIKNLIISVNEKKEIIKAYFQKNKNINFIEEKFFLGTAGSLKLLQGKFNKSFFLCNCDNLIKSDLKDFYKFHINGNYDLSIIASMFPFIIPYGVFDIEKTGNLISISEKPKLDFPINTGMYLLKPSVIKYIPKNSFFDMTDLIKKMMKKKLNIGIYPVSEQSWVDLSLMNKEL